MNTINPMTLQVMYHHTCNYIKLEINIYNEINRDCIVTSNISIYHMCKCRLQMIDRLQMNVGCRYVAGMLQIVINPCLHSSSVGYCAIGAVVKYMRYRG